MKRIGLMFYAVCLFLYVGIPVYGQSDLATITGAVSDSSGAILPGAHILVTNIETGTNVTGVTNQAGIYTVPGLPVGTYNLKISHSGFKDYLHAGIILTAAQVLQLNIHMAVGSVAQTVTVSGAPLLETETSTVSTTMGQSTLRDLPLNATNGRDAMNLMLATAPAVSGEDNFNQNFISFAGGETNASTVYLNGVESTSGLQGDLATPGLDALQEVQVQTNVADAALAGTGGGVEMFQIKSGTNQFHGSAFEYLQNEDLNANTWASNYFLAQCAPSDASCRSEYARARDRFNDYGGSAGGPLWRRHTFIFGDYEYYNQTDDRIIPDSLTVPTPQMLTGDFSQLLTGGTRQGDVLTSNGTPWINPCTGQPYQYGQVFDPQTQRVVGGQTCAAPFPGNIIPPERLSAVSQKVAQIYSKYYAPTISTRIYDNFPSMAGDPYIKKTSIDLRLDQYLSQTDHLSFTYSHVDWDGPGVNGGFNYFLNDAPFSSYWISHLPSNVYQLVDTYTISPNLVNTAAAELSQQINVGAPQVKTNPSTYGFDDSGSTTFPMLTFGSASNGVGVTTDSLTNDSYYEYLAYHYQDTAIWSRGRHSIKMGGTFMAQEMNSNSGDNIQTYSFANDTGGPTDPGLTPFVGSGFASFILGNVQSASQQIPQYEYPRQKTVALFVQDDYRAKPTLTLNLGLRWDVTLPGHEQAGRWQNFDLTAQNPLWGSYLGAWVFANNSGTTFETSEDYHQFGPHIGGAYQLSKKLVLRSSYGLFYVPLGAFSTGFGPYFPANQNSLSFPIDQVLNNVAGATAFNWDGGYPGVQVFSPQNSTATSMGSTNAPLYIHPDMLHLGYTQNWYVGTEYATSENTQLDISYMANRGRNLHDDGRSVARNYPSYSTYQSVLAAGNINDQISSAAGAAAAGVPYPYSGFSGPAYAAIAPFPQVASSDNATVLSFGDPSSSAVSAYNALIVEFKARNAHHLFVDFSYALSKSTGSAIGLSNFGNNWSYPVQNLADWEDAKHWVQPTDQRHLVKGYLTYQLPFGLNRPFLSGSRAVDYFVGGWELGYYGSYGSGTPLGPVLSPYQLPYFFSDQRVNFAAGQNAYSLRNHFGKHVDLNNLNDASNNDFNPKLFTATSSAAPFGNTPFLFNKWRWNTEPAQENLSVTKHFNMGPEGRYDVSLRADFYDVLNRHYYGAPDTNFNDSTFGQVTGVSGNRVGQLSGRFQW